MIRLILLVAVVFSLYSLNAELRRPYFATNGADKIQGWPLVHYEKRHNHALDHDKNSAPPFERHNLLSKCLNFSLVLSLTVFQINIAFCPSPTATPSRIKNFLIIATLLFAITMIPVVSSFFVSTRERVFPPFAQLNFENFS